MNAINVIQVQIIIIILAVIIRDYSGLGRQAFQSIQFLIPVHQSKQLLVEWTKHPSEMMGVFSLMDRASKFVKLALEVQDE